MLTLPLLLGSGCFPFRVTTPPGTGALPTELQPLAPGAVELAASASVGFGYDHLQDLNSGLRSGTTLPEGLTARGALAGALDVGLGDGVSLVFEGSLRFTTEDSMSRVQARVGPRGRIHLSPDLGILVGLGLGLGTVPSVGGVISVARAELELGLGQIRGDRRHRGLARLSVDVPFRWFGLNSGTWIYLQPTVGLGLPHRAPGGFLELQASAWMGVSTLDPRFWAAGLGLDAGLLQRLAAPQSD